MLREKLSCGVRAKAVHDIVDTVRNPRLLYHISQQRRGRRRLFRWLNDDGVTACERRGNLPGKQQQRQIPRSDDADDTERLAHGVVERGLSVRRFSLE